MRSGTFQFLEVLQGITATEELIAFSAPSESSCFSIPDTSGQAVLCVFRVSHFNRDTEKLEHIRRTKPPGNCLRNWSSRKGWKPRLFTLEGRNLKRSWRGLKHTGFLRNSTWWCEAFQGIPPLRTRHREAHETAAAESCREPRKTSQEQRELASTQLQPLVGWANFHRRNPIRGLCRLPSGTPVWVLQTGWQRLLQTCPLLRTARLTQLQKPRLLLREHYLGCVL